MTTPLLELEGTTEEIKALLPDYGRRRMHISISPVETDAEIGQEASSKKLGIEEKIAALYLAIPLEERLKLPADLSDNLDHYIYGWPKK